MNKKYYFIPDQAELFEILKEKSIGTYAKELAEQTGVDYKTLHSSITWIKNRWFTKDQKKQVKKDKNKRTNAQIKQDENRKKTNKSNF